MLGPDDVLPGVADVVTEVAVEAVFDDGSRLVVVHDPVGGGHLGDEAPGAVVRAEAAPAAERDDAVEAVVTNTAPVPISVSSHFHFFEVNARLNFDRAAAYGRHLDVPAGDTVRFDPGAAVAVRLVPFGGERVVVGFSGLVDGPLDAPGARETALERARLLGFEGAQ